MSANEETSVDSMAYYVSYFYRSHKAMRLFQFSCVNIVTKNSYVTWIFSSSYLIQQASLYIIIYILKIFGTLCMIGI